jgi:hypothetical protein
MELEASIDRATEGTLATVGSHVKRARSIEEVHIIFVIPIVSGNTHMIHTYPN